MNKKRIIIFSIVIILVVSTITYFFIKNNYKNLKFGNNMSNKNIKEIEDTLTVFMRVNNVYHDKKIVVREDDKVIASFKRKHLAPSEMEKILLSKALLKDVIGDLTISLEDGE